jgi:hypothetical protein
VADEAPDSELVRAMLDALRGDEAMIRLVGAAAIFDRVPEPQEGAPEVPADYVSLGPTDSVPADFDCLEGEEITVQFDAYSTGPGEAYGSAKIRKIAGAIKRCLHDRELTLGGNALVSLQLTLKRIFRDPDGITNHAVLQFTATVETP